MLIVERKHRVIAVCAGRPKDCGASGWEGWESLQLEASGILESARPKLNFGKKVNRRGGFPALPCGISYGGGQPYPKVLSQKKKNEKVLEAILKENAFERISGFAAGEFKASQILCYL
jgi:hypothetical protein